MKKLALPKVIIVAATVALGSFSIATDALARGGGGGGMHLGGGGGGMHLGGGGGMHLGGDGGLHLGGGQLGGAHVGGAHLGGTHIGGTDLGTVHLGGAAMARAPSGVAGAHLSGRHVGTGLGTAGDLHVQHAHGHDTHRHSRHGFAGLYDDGYSGDTCWEPYRFHLHWRRRWICG